MKKEIIINATSNEIRIALTEDDRLTELYVETPDKERMVGDIYLGKVARVMPGIRAAFIDIGHKQDAFLHFSDIGNSFNEYAALLGDEDSDVDTEEESEEEPTNETAEISEIAKGGEKQTGISTKHALASRNLARSSPKQIPNLVPNQDIIVQVTKEPIGKKGVRVTSEVSLPGRFLVLMPFDNQIGVSRRITNFKEKRRLRRIVRSILPPGFGVIIRTVAQDQDEQTLRQDIEKLIESWREIEKSVKTEQAPALLYKDLATTSSVIRDLFREDISRVVTDSKKLYREIRGYVKTVSPELVDKVELYRGKEPIFDVYGIEKEIATSLSRKVWLKNGSYIVIDQTEAMVVIDVNSGRYAGKQDHESNSLKTNLEAAREICRQLRLRDIGGLIVVDFIDLEDEKNRKKIYDELRKEFRKDRAKVTVIPMSEFGIVQITRQRIRQNILQSFSEHCPTCGGSGLVLSRSSIVNHIERWVRRFRYDSSEFRLLLRVHPSVAAYLRKGTFSRLLKICLRYRVWIKVQEDEKLPVDEFRFYSIKSKKDISDLYKL